MEARLALLPSPHLLLRPLARCLVRSSGVVVPSRHRSRNIFSRPASPLPSSKSATPASLQHRSFECRPSEPLWYLSRSAASPADAVSALPSPSAPLSASPLSQVVSAPASFSAMSRCMQFGVRLVSSSKTAAAEPAQGERRAEAESALPRDSDAQAAADARAAGQGQEETAAAGADRKDAASAPRGEAASSSSPSAATHELPTSESAVSGASAAAPRASSTVEASAAALDAAGASPASAPTAGAKAEEATQEKKWKFRHFVFGGLCLGLVGSFTYLLVENDFNVAKTEWVIGEKIRAAVFATARGDPRQDAIDHSRFCVGLSDELRRELAIFFLQLDLDKPNGVRRSDVIELIGKLGFSASSGVCKIFLEAGKGRTADVKRVAGVTLQEFAELIEGLILEEELDETKGSTEQLNNAGNIKSPVSGSAPLPASEGEPESDKQTTQNHANEPREKAAYRVLKYFRDINKTTTVPSTIPSCYAELADVPTGPPKRSHDEASSGAAAVNAPQQGVSQPPSGAGTIVTVRADVQDSNTAADTADELQSFRLQMGRAERVVRDLSALKARRGLSEAENTRLEDAKSEVKMLQQEIWRREATAARK
ncbi:hypothetical protein BESB_023800 [Besnoitia besnoiti]|uniref:EF-hand domain-containing protein n=1 Tax=Besnoitia besnoiti TaxID=94643 RepID=A0A2A9LZV0_BESBE|nr:hypothetical protein BESB_023800 [Besnoitia besnoiti]PFH31888.1 hypothetical protein BESB_023800 [Besnoitia besnoiti]